MSRPAEEFRRKVRIACQAFNVHRALWPKLRRLPLLDRYKYVSHKLLRWLTIYLLGASAALLSMGVGLLDWRLLAALAAAGGIAAAATALAPKGLLAALRDILAAFVATGLGVLHSLRGERYQTWNPPSSARGQMPAPRGPLPARGD